PPARHALGRCARLSACAAHLGRLNRGHRGGRHGLLREARAPMEGTMTSLLRPLVEDLHARREQIRLGGGQEKIDRQHEKGALTARERIALLVDEGTFDGRLTAVCAYDFTVMAGSMGMTGEFKVTRLRELALTKRIPFVWLLDSAGARVQEAAGAMFAGSGHLFREEVIMS